MRMTLKRLEKPDFHNRKRAEALLTVAKTPKSLPERQNEQSQFCLSGRFRLSFVPVGNASLAYGYENQAFQANGNNVFNPSFASVPKFFIKG